MDDKKLEELLNQEESEFQKKQIAESKRFEKKIQISIFKNTFKNICFIFLTVTLIFTAIFYYNKSRTYNVTKNENFDNLILVAFSHFYPDYSIIAQSYIQDVKYTNKGYEFKCFITNNHSPQSTNNNAIMIVDHNKISIECDYKTNTAEYAYPTSIIYSYGLNRNENDINEQFDIIQRLPETAYIQARVEFNESLSTDEVAKKSNMITDTYSSIDWIGFDLDNQKIMRQLILGTKLDYYQYRGYDEQKYPNLFLTSNTFTGDEIQEHFLSELKFLKDNPDFNKLFNESFEGIKNEDLDHFIQIVENEKLYVNTLNVRMKKDVFLDAFTKEEIKVLDLKDIDVSYIK